MRGKKGSKAARVSSKNVRGKDVHKDSTNKKSVKEVITALADRVPLVHFEDLPQWLQDNPYIRRGYRVDIGWKKSCRSACHLHNETVNIWSHLGAFIAMATLLAVTAGTLSPYGIDRMDFDVWNPVRPALPVASGYTFDAFNANTCPAPLHPHDDHFEAGFDIVRLTERLPGLGRITKLLRCRAEAAFPHIASESVFLRYITGIEDRLQRLEETLSTMSQGMGDARDSSRAAMQDAVQKVYSTLYSDNSDFMGARFQSFMLQLLNRRHLDMQDATNFILQGFETARGGQHGRRGDGVNESSHNATTPFTFKLSPSSEHLQAYMPTWPLAVYIMSAMICLAASATYHLFCSVNYTWAVYFRALDFAGIAILIAGSTLPVVYYGFFCSPTWQYVYSCIVVVLGIGCSIVAVLPYFDAPEFKVFRSLMFFGMAFFAVIPVIHMFIHIQDAYWFLAFLLVMGACYSSGMVVYLLQIPEAWYPGTFDIYFASHQIWHLLIIVAVLVHYVGLLNFFEWRIKTECPSAVATTLLF